MNNLIKATRKALELSQAEFGRWIAEKIGRKNAFLAQRVSEWERGVRSPRKNVRDACLPIVAAKIADDAIESVRNGEQLNIVRDTIKSRIIENTR